MTARRSKAESVGEQLDLIDVHPKNQKDILRAARAYKKAQRERTIALTEEGKQKIKLLAAVKEGNLVADRNGRIACRIDGTIITVTPRDELVRVKFEEDANGNDEEDAQ